MKARRHLGSILLFPSSLALLLLSFSMPTTSAIANISTIKRAVTTGVSISQPAYVTTFSLGDEITTDGVALTVDYDDDSEANITSGLSFTGGDRLTLGKQDIVVSYEGKSATYEIDVTNEKATVDALVASNLLITEVYRDDGMSALEIYNGTASPISLGDYALQIYHGLLATTIDLPATPLAANTAFIVSNDAFALSTEVAVDHEDAAFDLAAAADIVLFDQVKSAAVDIFNISTESLSEGVRDGVPSGDEIHLSRFNKVCVPVTTFDPLEWIMATAMETFGSHAFQAPTIVNEQQAVSYARYVMYGIGMNAASNYFNVFFELQEEYGFMVPYSKEYFLENRSHTISGINETGNLVTNTFNDAIGRYNYLAAKAGNAGLTSSSSWFDGLDFEAIGQFAGFAVIIVGAALLFVYTKKRWSL